MYWLQGGQLQSRVEAGYRVAWPTPSSGGTGAPEIGNRVSHDARSNRVGFRLASATSPFFLFFFFLFLWKVLIVFLNWTNGQERINKSVFINLNCNSRFTSPQPDVLFHSNKLCSKKKFGLQTGVLCIGCASTTRLLTNSNCIIQTKSMITNKAAGNGTDNKYR